MVADTRIPRIEAMLYEKLAGGRVRCHLCNHHCVISDGTWGLCDVRQNEKQTLFTLTYGHPIAEHVEPVEKKPLFHFYPGSTAYSIGTAGCNFRCRWCQNWQISQAPCKQPRVQRQGVLPAQIVAAAKRAGSRSIAYTYTEPTVFFEYVYETAQLAHENGLANLLVTNGYMTQEAWDMLQPWLDAANVDLKAFRESTYRKYVGARLQPILDNMKHLKQQGVWLEVTTLVIPGIDDDPSELQDVATFVARELGSETPWHISRFFPAYQMTDVPPTPLATLQQAQQIGRDAGLAYVYLGNVQDGGSTFCPRCGELLIHRSLLGVVASRVLTEGCCPSCGADVAGIGMGFQDPSTGKTSSTRVRITPDNHSFGDLNALRAGAPK